MIAPLDAIEWVTHTDQSRVTRLWFTKALRKIQPKNKLGFVTTGWVETREFAIAQCDEAIIKFETALLSEENMNEQ